MILQLLGRFLQFFVDLASKPTKKDPIKPPTPAPVPPPVPEPTPTPPPAPDPRLALFNAAVAHLGTDASPNDLAPDELGCAETVSTLMREAYGDNPIMVGTAQLCAWLTASKKYARTLDPVPGTIIISPTGQGTNPNMPNGHTGILHQNSSVMSNSSSSGKFQINYTLAAWVERYRRQGGYPVYFFMRVV